MSDDTLGDGVLDITLEREREMAAEHECDLPQNVFVSIMQESAGAHSAVMNESKSNSVFQNGLLRTIAAKKFDEIGPSESRSDVVARSPSA